MPLTPIDFMSGPAGKTPRDDPTNASLHSWYYRQDTLVPLPYASHAGDDVGVYATGPFSEIFHRTVDNTFIAQAMKFALGVEPYVTTNPPCDSLPKTTP